MRVEDFGPWYKLAAMITPQPGAVLRVVAPVALGTLIVPLDTAVNIAFPAITRAFDQPGAMIQWIVICYVLTYGSLMLGIGRLGDLFGYRLVFGLGLAWSVVAFLLCALAPSYGWLLAFRIAQGVGAALVISCGAALMTTPFPEAMRGRLLGYYATALAAGAVLGPIVGGVLVEHFGWSAVFWFRAPIALIALLLLRLVPRAQAPASGGYDLAGAALLALSVITFLMALRETPHLFGGGWWPIALALGFAASLAAFLARSASAERPVLHLRHFRNPDFALVNGANVLVSFAGFAVLLIVPFWLVRMGSLAEGWAGLLLATSPLGGMAAGLLGGSMLGRVSPQRLAALGLAFTGAGLLLVARWHGGSGVPMIALSLALHGAGLGLFQLAYTDIVTATMPREDRGVAGSLAMMSRTLGVVGAASLLTWLREDIELSWRAQGASAEVAANAAFGSVFALVGAIPLALLALGALRAIRRRQSTIRPDDSI